MSIEEPSFTVEKNNSSFEIRNYKSTLVAETQVDSDFEAAGNMAFRILADYIFGNNRSKLKIGMTAPVSQIANQVAALEKIEMTAPVSQIKKDDGYTVQFTMPEKFSIETLPTPNDKRVQLRQIPARRMAVYSYSGSWSESRYQKNLSEFLVKLDQAKLKTKGEPIFARFNSPFQIWFLRRNEIWIEIY